MKYVKKLIFVCFVLTLAACSKEALDKPVDTALIDGYTAVDSDMLFSPDLEVEVISEAHFHYTDGRDGTHETEIQMAAHAALDNSISSRVTAE